MVSAPSMSASVAQTCGSFGPFQSYGSLRNASAMSMVAKYWVSSGWPLMPVKSRCHSSMSSRIARYEPIWRSSSSSVQLLAVVVHGGVLLEPLRAPWSSPPGRPARRAGRSPTGRSPRRRRRTAAATGRCWRRRCSCPSGGRRCGRTSGRAAPRPRARPRPARRSARSAPSSSGSPHSRVCARPIWSSAPPAASMPTMPGWTGSMLASSSSGPVSWPAASIVKCGKAQTQ